MVKVVTMVVLTYQFTIDKEVPKLTIEITTNNNRESSIADDITINTTIGNSSLTNTIDV